MSSSPRERIELPLASAEPVESPMSANPEPPPASPASELSPEQYQEIQEKIVAALAQRFVCIADESKRVPVLGNFPLPVEVIPMAAAQIARRFEAMGADVTAQIRMKDGAPLVTDNGQHILDVRGLKIAEPLAFESEVNQWPGVVTVGVFAHQKAAVCLLGTAQGVQTLEY